MRSCNYTNSPREVFTSRGLFASSLMIKFNYARCTQKLISFFRRFFSVALYISFANTISRPTYKLFKRSSTDFIRSSKFTGVSIVRSKIVRTSCGCLAKCRSAKSDYKACPTTISPLGLLPCQINSPLLEQFLTVTEVFLPWLIRFPLSSVFATKP